MDKNILLFFQETAGWDGRTCQALQVRIQILGILGEEAYVKV